MSADDLRAQVVPTPDTPASDVTGGTTGASGGEVAPGATGDASGAQGDVQRAARREALREFEALAEEWSSRRMTDGEFAMLSELRAVLAVARRCPECGRLDRGFHSPRWRDDPVAQQLGIAKKGCPECGSGAVEDADGGQR